MYETTFADIYVDLANECSDYHVHKTDRVTVTISEKLNSPDCFHPDLQEPLLTMKNFNNLLKCVRFKVERDESVGLELDLKDQPQGKKRTAFTEMMESSTKRKPPPLKDQNSLRFTGKDKMYNNICDEMAKCGAEFPLSMTNDVIRKHVSAITDVLWYLDGNMEKIMERSLHYKDVKPVPKRFLQSSFKGLNDWKKKKQKAPSIQSTEIKKHSSALFNIVTCAFTAQWGEFRRDLEHLAISLDAYATFLDMSNDAQQKRQILDHPVRQVGDHAFLEHRTSKTDVVFPQYSILDDIMARREKYSYLLYDEKKHTSFQKPMDSQQRWNFLKYLKLSVPVDILTYNPGGAVGSTIVLWRTNEERATDEVMQCSVQVYEKIRVLLPEFHTRQMRKMFVSKFCNLPAVSVPPAVLRVIYTELTLDSSAEQNKGIENRIREAILSEDPDIVTDLRHLNPGRPNDTFNSFFDKLSEIIEDMTAADERRHNVEHLSQFVSVRDLINQVASKLPEHTNIPSESTVLFAFVPKNSHTNVSKLYKSKIPLQFKVQTRQLRSSHQDDHYCAAVFKYSRHFSVKYKPSVTFLCVDDKSKVDFGEPGLYVSTGVRGKKSIAPMQSNLSALDHDMQSKGSLTPSVCLELTFLRKKMIPSTEE
ncbi:uncharacterized protein LOC134242028 [Saccostrea cucullata]|uniref:uncharacterized protein LOC134242028 n=1 Tax=Saccostrea cuccullata TaxID=36930 RepID=UPI002ED0FC37